MRKGLAKFPATLQCQTPLTQAVRTNGYSQEVLALEFYWRFGETPGAFQCRTPLAIAVGFDGSDEGCPALECDRSFPKLQQHFLCAGS